MMTWKEIFEAAQIEMVRRKAEASEMNQWSIKHLRKESEIANAAVRFYDENVKQLGTLIEMMAQTEGRFVRYEYTNMDTGEVIYADSGDELDVSARRDETWDGAVVMIRDLQTNERDFAYPIRFAE